MKIKTFMISNHKVAPNTQKLSLIEAVQGVPRISGIEGTSK